MEAAPLQQAQYVVRIRDVLSTRLETIVDPVSVERHHWFVSTEATNMTNRRSTRVFTRIPVRAAGKSSDGKKFHENSQTIVVNAHGGLIYLQEALELGADIVLINPVTEEEQECRVVYIGDMSDRGHRVGLEFNSPAPHFWGVDFAPGDWPGRASDAPIR
jgi:hypothetical protein